MHLVLFDIDGTLITGFGMGRLALERSFEEVFGVEAVERPAVRTVAFNGRSDPVIIAGMAEVLGVDADRLLEERVRFDAAYLRHLEVTVAAADHKRPCPGVVEILGRLHRDPGVALGLLTGNVERGARIKLEPFGFNAYFPFGGFGDDGPDRSILARLARERAEAHHAREFPPERIALIGDTVHDIAAARAHGYSAVGVETGGVDAATLRASGADAVFPDLGPSSGFDDWLDAFLRRDEQPAV